MTRVKYFNLFFLSILLAFGSLNLSAQHGNFYFNSFLKQQRDLDKPVALFVDGDLAKIAQFVEEKGGVYKYTTNGSHAITATKSVIQQLAQQPFVQGFQFNMSTPVALTDSSLSMNNVNPIQQGMSPLLEGYEGQDILVGFIDNGIDVNHGDFKDENGDTKILYLWDQTTSDDPERIPPTYGYGKLWDSTDINQGICTHVDGTAHGSTVAGVAVSSGNETGNYAGVAPKANIIMVATDFNANNWTSTIADAIDFIFHVADSLGVPCVVNTSVGTYIDPHDARDLPAQRIEDLLDEKPGRVVVAAAGNSGGLVYHVENYVDSDTSFTWYTVNPASGLGYPALFFEVWADTTDFNQVHFAVGADKKSPNYEFRGNTMFRNIQSQLNQLVSDSLISLDGNYLGTVDYWAAESNGRYQLQVHMAQPDSSQYNFRFMTTGSGRFDVWSSSLFSLSDVLFEGLPDSNAYPDMKDYVYPDENKSMVGSWTCSDKVITVANYTGRLSYVDYNGDTQVLPGTVGEITANSSFGPTRDNRQKPDIASTGNIIISTGSIPILETLKITEPHKLSQDSMHMRNGGTSMASPIVSGIAALYLQKCPTATWSEIKAAITATGNGDSFTGTLPNNRWGYGKVDGFAALITSSFEAEISVDSIFCEGDSILVSADTYDTYSWSSGQTTNSFYGTSSDTVWLVATNGSGCKGRSKNLQLMEMELPDVPLLSQNMDTVFASGDHVSYTWYLDGDEIEGETGSYVLVETGGEYTAEGHNVHCSSLSDPLSVSLASIAEFDSNLQVFPNPASEHITVLHKNEIKQVRIFDCTGKQVTEVQNSGNQVTIPTSNLENGVYLMQIQAGETQFTQRISVIRN